MNVILTKVIDGAVCVGSEGICVAVGAQCSALVSGEDVGYVPVSKAICLSGAVHSCQ